MKERGRGQNKKKKRKNSKFPERDRIPVIRAKSKEVFTATVV